MRKPSPNLTLLLKRWNTPRRRTKADEAFIKAMTDYPHNRREAVFCWLWVNHEGVHEMVERWKCSWHGVAKVMELDGVVGSRGAPPTGNAVRRVWGRVCREIKEGRGRR